MNIFLFKFLIKYNYYIPKKIKKFLFLNNVKYTKSENLFDIIEYKSDYNKDNLIFFFFPLLINIFQIFIDIEQSFNKDKIISIISVLTFYEGDTMSEYIHSLSNSNKLYSLENFNEWPYNLLLNIIKKLELYNSFKKISLIIKVKKITNL